MANVILMELREFREENNKKWEVNEKRWEENDRRWEANEKRWEENDRRWKANEKRWEENNKRWNENQQLWIANNQKWEVNEKRWEENNKRWNENQQLWIANNQKWEANDKKWKESTKILAGINERVIALEEGRKKDRLDLIDILDTMEKSISNQFNEMKEYFDVKFEKVFISQKVNDMEHAEFKKLVCAHEGRLNFYNARISRIEEWKEQFDMGEFTAV